MEEDMTENQEKRWRDDWSKIAGEAVNVELLCGVRYAYASELACLRLAYAFRECGDRVKAQFSQNLRVWFFRLEPVA